MRVGCWIYDDGRTSITIGEGSSSCICERETGLIISNFYEESSALLDLSDTPEYTRISKLHKLQRSLEVSKPKLMIFSMSRNIYLQTPRIVFLTLTHSGCTDLFMSTLSVSSQDFHVRHRMQNTYSTYRKTASDSSTTEGDYPFHRIAPNSLHRENESL